MSVDIDKIKKNKVAKIKCKKSLLFHTRYFFKKRYHRKFIVGDHHKIIADTLERVIKGELKRVIINIAPRYGKTELAVKNFISHCLALNPSAKFMHLSYSDDLALDNSEDVKDTIISDEFQELFPEVQLKKDSKSKKKWYTTAGGGVYATSSSGQVTGFGAGKVDDEDAQEFINDIEQKEGFGGAIVIDDPIKPEDADSGTKRDKVNEKYDSTIKNRVNSRNTPIIIIMQRLHEEDLCGFLIEREGEDWEVVKLPCIKEDGTALWDFKHTIEELNKLKQLNSVVFDRQYQQDPQPLEGILWHPSKLNYFENLSVEDCVTVAYADTADEGDDHFSMPIAKVVNGKVYIVDVVFNQSNLTINHDLVLAKIKERGIDHLYIESNNAGASFIRNLRESSSCSISAVKNTANKQQRIFAESGWVENNFYFKKSPEDEYYKFFKQLTRYTKNGGSNQKDDSPDSIAGLSWCFRRYFIDLFE